MATDDTSLSIGFAVQELASLHHAQFVPYILVSNTSNNELIQQACRLVHTIHHCRVRQEQATLVEFVLDILVYRTDNSKVIQQACVRRLDPTIRLGL